MKIKNLRLGRLGTTVVFLFAIIAAQFSHVQFASAASLTWDGSSGDG
jgi:hypothetical protein